MGRSSAIVPDRQRGLADRWPTGGPHKLWSIRVGGGHAGIAIRDATAFTLVREEQQEVAIAFDTASGAVRWRRSESIPDRDLDYGMGPFSTPVAMADRVVFLGVTGVLRAHRITDGKLLWRRDLDRDYPGTRPDRGYAPGPLVVGDRIIVQCGSPNASVIAVSPQNGATIWARHSFGSDYASPIAVKVAGDTQLVCHMQEEIIGLEPKRGDLLWRHPSESERTQHVICPLDLGNGHIIVSTTRGVERLKLSQRSASVVWTSRRVRAQVGNLLYIPAERILLGATAARTGSPVTALDVESGDELWRDRGIDCGFLWQAGERTFNLAPDGDLVHGVVRRSGLRVLSAARVVAGPKAWSAPAMLGSTLLVKDQNHTVALDLSRTE